MGSSSVLTNDNNFDDSRTNLAQSPITHESSYTPSPSTSTGFNYANVPARSVPDLQIPISPKTVVQQQQPPQQQQHQQQQQQPQHQQMKPVTPKQQPMPKPSVVIQQCMFRHYLKV